MANIKTINGHKPSDINLLSQGIIKLDDALSCFMEIENKDIRNIMENICYGLLRVGENIVSSMDGD